MSAPNKKKNQIELEENLLDQEHYISPEQQKYYDDIFEEPENITQSMAPKELIQTKVQIKNVQFVSILIMTMIYLLEG